jgi:Rrf2 family cysteine metabolism transcriptional repressor
MRFSSKGRYAAAAMIYMAQQDYTEEQVTVLSISQNLGISKIYLEQVFSMLKRANLVLSLKGSQGGYRLASSPDRITAGDIARAVETSLFEKTENTVAKEAEGIDKAMRTLLWDRLDQAVAASLDAVTLAELAEKSAGYDSGDNFMFFI